MKKLFIIAFILMCGINTSFGQYEKLTHWYTPEVTMWLMNGIGAFQHTVVSAHRGLHKGFPDTPENSLQAILRAAQKGVDAVELDIKLTQNGVPILSHDDNLARMTFGPYNPFNAGKNVPSIKNINEQQSEDITKLKLRKINFNSNGFPIYTKSVDGPLWSPLYVGNPDNETVPSLRQALQFIKDKGLPLVVMLDLKDVKTALACWEIVNGMSDCNGFSFSRTVIFKMSLKALGYQDPFQGLVDLKLLKRGTNPEDFTTGDNTTMKFVPVYNGNDIDNLKQYRTNPVEYYKKLVSTINTRVSGYIYPEINAKRISGGGKDVYFGHLYYVFATAGTRLKGVFHPVEEVPQRSGTENYGFYRNTGLCCFQLKEMLFESAHYGQKEIEDVRTNIPLLAPHYRVIITDSPLEVITERYTIC